jgi:hypothetical protein
MQVSGVLQMGGATARRPFLSVHPLAGQRALAVELAFADADLGLLYAYSSTELNAGRRSEQKPDQGDVENDDHKNCTGKRPGKNLIFQRARHGPTLLPRR